MDRVDELSAGAEGDVTNTGITSSKGRRVRTQTKDVVKNEYLTIRVWSGTNTDRWNGDCIRDFTRQIGWYTLNHRRKCASGINALGILEDAISTFEVTSLDLVSTHPVIALRRQSNVAHDGDVNTTNSGDGVIHRRATFELDCRRSSLDQLDRATNPLFAVHVIGAEGQIADDERLWIRSGDETNVILHLLDRDGNRGAYTLDDGSNRVADENHVDSGFIDDSGEGGVVGGDHGQRRSDTLA